MFPNSIVLANASGVVPVWLISAYHGVFSCVNSYFCERLPLVAVAVSLGVPISSHEMFRDVNSFEQKVLKIGKIPCFFLWAECECVCVGVLRAGARVHWRAGTGSRSRAPIMHARTCGQARRYVASAICGGFVFYLRVRVVRVCVARALMDNLTRE